ncbi:CHAT domain-containing protein [Streptomyces marispadix]|uniref:CHAT domain-containing protein n=1 Tax=Streptomyces marispadix TaxID=2922868 RepID=A0ABS9T656_9ACTN|nr:CHAT domain-containing protein [Streptomyces marispadix]MCH6164028.1 CHAT domain-containing protein [Streptomyces marispadix]
MIDASYPEGLPDVGNLTDTELRAERDRLLSVLGGHGHGPGGPGRGLDTAAAWGVAGEWSLALYMREGETEDLAQAAAALERAVSETAGSPARGAWRVLLGHVQALGHDLQPGPERARQAYDTLLLGVSELEEGGEPTGYEELLHVGRLQLAYVMRVRCERFEDQDECVRLQEEVLPRLQAAFGRGGAGSVRAAELRLQLADLYCERGARTGDPEDFHLSAGHSRAALAVQPPDADVAHLRFALAKAQMLGGLTGADRELLKEAGSEFAMALDEAGGEGEAEDEPEWGLEARARRAFITAGLGLERGDTQEMALAEHGVEEVLAEPDFTETAPAGFLDLFARLLYELAADRLDGAGRERALGLLRHVAETRDPVHDDGTWHAALVLAALQQDRYGDDADPARLTDVDLGARVVLESPDCDEYVRHVCRMMRAWAHKERIHRGLPGDHGGGGDEHARADGQLTLSRESLRTLLENYVDGRSYLGFPRPAGTGATAGGPAADAERLRGVLDEMYARWEQQEPGSDTRAEFAWTILGLLPWLEAHGTYLTGQQKRALIDSAVNAPANDGGWGAHEHILAASSQTAGDRITGAPVRLEQLHGPIDGDPARPGPDAPGRPEPEGRPGAYQSRLAEAQNAAVDGVRALRSGDLARADAAIARLSDVHAGLGREDRSRVELWAVLENLILERDQMAGQLGLPRLQRPRGRPSTAELRRGAAELPRGQRAWVLGSAGLVRGGRAAVKGDFKGLTEATELLEEALELVREGSDEWLRYAGALGVDYCCLGAGETRLSHRRQRLAQGVGLLEECVRLMQGPSHRFWTSTNFALARAYRARGEGDDRERSRRTGLDALRGHAWSALLRSGTPHAAEAAAAATAGALGVAAWCVTDGAPDEAVRALESGRGVALHYALTSASVPELLLGAGFEDMAREWLAAGGGEGGSASFREAAGRDSGLRGRVVEALTSPGGSARSQSILLRPPSREEICRALSAMETDALVYLVPASDEEGGGVAVLVTADGWVGSVPLPLLSEDAAPLRAYRSGGHEAGAAGLVPGGGAAPDPAPLRGRLDRLCSWAWYAAMEPLVSALGSLLPGGGGLPRVVLVPVGGLGAVPWHAAWGPVDESAEGGARRYAIEAAEISYAASARLLCEVAARGAPALTDSALVVGDPTGGLRHAVEEADAVQRLLYPGARFLGWRESDPADGAGTPQEVLDWLTGKESESGVLHLACPGTDGEPARLAELAGHPGRAVGGRRSAFLSLAGGELTAEQITAAGGRGAAGEGGGPGLVVLAGSSDGVSRRGQSDAYSLSTAFLAAGARSVVGSLWPVPDHAASVLMFMTHWFLRRGHEPPERALRRAQLWMLDPARTVPAGMPAWLADRARTADPDDLAAWAGFTHLGW